MKWYVKPDTIKAIDFVPKCFVKICWTNKDQCIIDCSPYAFY